MTAAPVLTAPALVRLEVDNGIGTIRLNRPPMNALNRQVQDQLRAAAAEATNRDDVRAVIVYGGEKVFAAGADVKEMAEMSYAQISAIARHLSAGLTSPATIPKPTVAAITGYALGGGLEVALACDRRIAADNATLGVPEILLGLIPGGGGTQRLARLVGPSKAKDLVYTGRLVSAEEGLSIGLVDEVVPAGQVYDRARTYVDQFVRGPKLAYMAAKRAIDGGLDVDLQTGHNLESDLFAGLFSSEDRVIGMRSFIQRESGKPKFVGR